MHFVGSTHDCAFCNLDGDARMNLDSRWYRPEDHFDSLLEYAKDLVENVPKTYAVLDLFGASQRVANTWIRNGYSAVAFDIKISASHDICTEAGFKKLLEMAMQWLVLILGPNLGHSFSYHSGQVNACIL